MQVDSLLSQIPYPYKGRVRADVVQLQQKTPTLRASVGEIVHNDGTHSSLLMLDGTIPMFVSGVKYNAPIAIYVVYNYPEASPLVYVRPVAGMMIKPGHAFVDNSGLTRDPYLASWRASTCTLCGLVDALSRAFSIAPPVYAVPPQQAQTQPPQRPQYSYGSGGSGTTNGSSAGGYGQSYAAGYVGSNTYSQPAVGQPAQQPPPVVRVVSMQAAASRKDDLVARVTARLQEEMTMYYSRVRDEIDKEFACQSELSHRRKVADDKMAELAETKKELTEELNRYKTKTDSLKAWAAEHAEDPPPSAEDCVQPYDGISSQLTSLIADNLATDDVMYYLERALASQRNKTVDLPIFLREVRNQSGKQFTNKMHIRRIHAVVQNSA